MGPSQQNARRSSAWKDTLRRHSRLLPTSNGNKKTDSVKAQKSNFSYNALNHKKNQIRLLQVSRQVASKSSQLLSFDVIATDLDSIVRRQYYTISYTWGENPGTARILLDGDEVEVPASAESALRGVLAGIHRGDHAKRPVWIDAICINQKDLNEKTHQVAMMGRVYSQAHTTFIWLGPDDGNTKHFVQTCLALQKERLGDSITRRSLRRPCIEPATDIPDLQDVDLPFPPDADEQILLAYLGARWFERLWVVQEVVLSKRVVMLCGDLDVPWDLFTAGVTCALESRGRDAEDGRLTSVYEMLRLKSLRQPREMVDLVQITFRRQCSEPLDRVYALLGMIEETRSSASQVTSLTPDYKKDIQEVYTDAMFLIMETSDCLEGLEVAQTLVPLPEDQLDHWPSWVPRLHEVQLGVQNVFPMGTDAYKADNDAEPDIILDYTSEWPLQIGGVIADVVDEVLLRLAIPDDKDHRLADTKLDLLEPIWDLQIVWSSRIVQSMARCLVSAANEYLDERGTPTQDFASCLLSLKRARNLPSRPELESILIDLGAEQGSGETFLENINLFDHHMLLRLGNGGIGLSHNGTKSGDMACILFGSDEPLIMRKVGNAWKLRGVAYIPGINKGEYVKTLQDGGRLEKETMIFRIN